MRGADVPSAEHVPSRSIPERGQVTEHDLESSRNEVCTVFHERERGSNLTNDARKFTPEATTRSADAGFVS